MKKLLQFGHPYKRYCEMACHGSGGCVLGFHGKENENAPLQHVCVLRSVSEFRDRFQYSLEKEVVLVGNLLGRLFEWLDRALRNNPDTVVAFYHRSVETGTAK